MAAPSFSESYLPIEMQRYRTYNFHIDKQVLRCRIHFISRPVIHSVVKNYIEEQPTKRWLHFGAPAGSRYGIIDTVLLCSEIRTTFIMSQL